MTTTFAPSDIFSRTASRAATRRTAGRTVARRTLDESLYVLVSFPLGIAGFVTVWTLVWLGLGLIPVFVGIFVLLAAVYVARGFAATERALQQNLLGRDPGRPTYKTGQGFGSVTAPLTDGRSWRDVAAALVSFATSQAAFIIVVTWWSMVLGGLTWFLWGWVTPDGGWIFDWLGSVLGWIVGSVVYFILGALALLALPWVVRAAAWIKYAPAAALTGGDSTADAGFAPVAVVTDAAPAYRVAAQSVSLVTPYAVENHGLAGAIDQLVAISPIPVQVDVTTDPVPDRIAGVVYRIVDEALANAKRHSGATVVHVNVERLGDILLVSVLDDGVGGADLARGSGLRRVQSFAAAVGGTLSVDSPYAGPTQVRATLPLG